MTKTRAYGFTIVELLIVIVVIGILASISVTAYAGFSRRAEDSAVAAQIKSLVRLVELYAATNDGLAPKADWACVGEPEDFPAENGYAAGWCHQPSEPEPVPSGNDHPVDATLNAKLKQYTDRIPSGKIPEVDLGGGVKYRGFHYDSSAGQAGGKPYIQYYLRGTRSSCPIGRFGTPTMGTRAANMSLRLLLAKLAIN